MTSNDAAWQIHFPQLHDPADEALARLRSRARYVQVSAKSRVFLPGSDCCRYLLVLGGHVHVRLFTESGRELFLYEVKAGESCILTTSCLLGGTAYPAEGVADDDVSAFAIASDDFFAALDGSRVFREFVFRDFSRCLANVMGKMAEVTTVDVDSRLVKLLLANGADRLVKTHQELAVQLGSAREVVSRHLKRLERLGWIRLGRGSITLTGRQAMEAYLRERRT